MSAADLVVYGATGLIGRRVCAELEAEGAAFAIAGRRAEAGRGTDGLDALAAQFPAARKRVAAVTDPDALARAFAGAKVVINCAGPPAEVGEPLLVAALAAGAHYVDLGGDQAFLHDIYERHESTARRAGRVAVPGCGLNCAIGDLAAAWAAAHVCGVVDDGDAVRSEPSPRLAEDQPFDELAVSYLYDDLVLSPANQRAVFGGLQARGLAWRRDRWETVAPAAERRRVNAGPEMGGERDATSFPGGDVITIPRHVAARTVQTFVSTTRNQVASTALRLLARAMPLVPRRATELLAPYTPDEREYARTHFAVVAQARRGFAASQVVVRGVDPYRASAGIAAWVARQLVTRGPGPIGMRAPSELFRPEPALREVATAVGLTVLPSFR